MEPIKNIVPSYIDNDNHNLKNNDNVGKSKKVDLIADKLVKALNNPNARTFYCKVGWKLPENVIWNNLEDALKGRNPVKLFSWLCKRDMTQ